MYKISYSWYDEDEDRGYCSSCIVNDIEELMEFIKVNKCSVFDIKRIDN